MKQNFPIVRKFLIVFKTLSHDTYQKYLLLIFVDNTFPFQLFYFFNGKVARIT